jgi:hypothetical protein
MYILVSPSANSRLHYAPSGKALNLGLKKMVKFAEGEQEINPTLKMYSSMSLKLFYPLCINTISTKSKEVKRAFKRVEYTLFCFQQNTLSSTL